MTSAAAKLAAPRAWHKSGAYSASQETWRSLLPAASSVLKGLFDVQRGFQSSAPSAKRFILPTSLLAALNDTNLAQFPPSSAARSRVAARDRPAIRRSSSTRK
jgi:hypothetical protein